MITIDDKFNIVEKAVILSAEKKGERGTQKELSDSLLEKGLKITQTDISRWVHLGYIPNSGKHKRAASLISKMTGIPFSSLTDSKNKRSRDEA